MGAVGVRMISGLLDRVHGLRSGAVAVYVRWTIHGFEPASGAVPKGEEKPIAVSAVGGVGVNPRPMSEQLGC